MSTLGRALRKTLADTIFKARDVAEEAARDAIRRLGIIDDEPPAYLSAEQKTLRVRLRAHARSLGDGWNGERKKLLSTRQLENEAAYEIWHRMLFGRFLVERGLLIHPDLGEPIAPTELADLAREGGEADPWALVERFAAPSLPAVFKPNDPVLAMTLDPALAKRLRDIVTGLPTEVFTVDDSLGWTYQFWRTSEKDAVNKSGVKVTAQYIPAVTQLFTERYMVQFLLHNTLGAWWAAKTFAVNPDLVRDAIDEQTLRNACALPGINWEYLRFVRHGENAAWSPAAGTFPSWPKTAAEITYCDPCCGSGHFLAESFLILAAMRQQEEGLSASDAARAVLDDNLHGLELDGRCVQIAAFNVALTAWKFAGHRITLPQPRIAWVGAPPPLSRTEMAALGGGEVSFRSALQLLHDRFAAAPLLGSLVRIGATDLLDADLAKGAAAALAELRQQEPEREEGAIAAQGLLHAAELLQARYVLIATNVPFLGRGKQDAQLLQHLDAHYPESKGDLATAMVDRFRSMLVEGGTVASVTPQNWLFLQSYSEMRRDLLGAECLSLVAGLGSRAFESITGEVVNAALIVVEHAIPPAGRHFSGFDLNDEEGSARKDLGLRSKPPLWLSQQGQLRNPDCRISLQPASGLPLLSAFAQCSVGFQNGDTPRWVQRFWEQADRYDRWNFFQNPVDETSHFGGCDSVFLWELGRGALARSEQAFVKGAEAWGKKGVLVRQMGKLPVCLYDGDYYDQSGSVIVPKSEADLPAIWSFCSSPEYQEAVRLIDRKMNVTTATMAKIPFDIRRWREIATSRYPDGLPEPSSDAPTEWLFHGHPAFAQDGTQLHVALARIAGYRWPAENGGKIRLSAIARERAALAAKLPETDADGLLPLHTAGSYRALADRLRTILAAAYGGPLSPAREAELVRASDGKLDKSGARDETLEAWLRDRAFRQHCMLFQHRPFIWQVWDGLRDGFSAFLHYQQLDHARLEKLTFTLLGDWIGKARAEGRTAHEERARHLQQKLRAILDGEAPHDIFVRWQPLSKQPVGWRPELDDGVRLNIRPFVNAGVLREQPRINWNNDRGRDLPSAPWFHLGPEYGGKEGDRINDHHLTLAEKRAAQNQAKAS